MPLDPLPIRVVQMLSRPNLAVMATVDAAGHPVTAVTWYLLEPDESILFALGAGRSRVRHLQQDPRISLTVLAADGAHTHVSLQGWVEGIFVDTHRRDSDRMARHYTGRPHPDRQSPRTTVRMRIDSWRLEKRSFPSALLHA